MLFNSITFLVFFLPVSLVVYFMLGRLGAFAAKFWLVLVSFIFYGWWNPKFLVLLAGSILVNYICGYFLQRNEERPKVASAILAFGVAVNLTALFYFKYLMALMTWFHSLGLPSDTSFGSLVLPLGISFFTFTQIGFLIDAKDGSAHERGFLDYVLFVTFFPHLIAGPILHHREIMPQYAQKETYVFRWDNIGVGLAIFIVGLAKKVLIADQLAPVANAVFEHPDNQHLVEAWTGVICYSMQLYFDFSGYSEMALGLARMFNVRFPANFDSPYKSRSIIDFWQRWHISLTRYLNLYLYNPISMAIMRKRMAKGLTLLKAEEATAEGFFVMLMVPTLYTMILAGIWHGAGLQFFIFGLLHGIYLCVNHAWRMFGPKAPGSQEKPVLAWFDGAWKWGLTYFCVLVAQIFFRAPNALGARMLIQRLFVHRATDSAGGPSGPIESILSFFKVDIPMWHYSNSLLTVLVAFIFVTSLPNVLQLFASPGASLTKTRSGRSLLDLVWSPNVLWGAALGLCAFFTLCFVTGTTEFIYFQF